MTNEHKILQIFMALYYDSSFKDNVETEADCFLTAFEDYYELQESELTWRIEHNKSIIDYLFNVLEGEEE